MGKLIVLNFLVGAKWKKKIWKLFTTMVLQDKCMSPPTLYLTGEGALLQG